MATPGIPDPSPQQSKGYETKPELSASQRDAEEKDEMKKKKKKKNEGTETVTSDVRVNIILGVKPLKTAAGYAAQRAEMQNLSSSDPTAKDRILEKLDKAEELSAKVNKGSRAEQLATFYQILDQIYDLTEKAVKNVPKDQNGKSLADPANNAQLSLLHDLRNMASVQANAFNDIDQIRLAEDARYRVINSAMDKLPLSFQDFNNKNSNEKESAPSPEKTNTVDNYDPDRGTGYALPIAMTQKSDKPSVIENKSTEKGLEEREEHKAADEAEVEATSAPSFSRPSGP